MLTLNLGNITSSNGVGPTSIFMHRNNISLDQKSAKNIIGGAIVITEKVSEFNNSLAVIGDKTLEAKENIACGTVEYCNSKCEESITFQGAEF